MEPTRESAIGEALRFVQVAGIFYCPSVLSEPWGLELPPMDDCVWFHAVGSGECTVDAGGSTHLVESGDVVLIPHGAGHRLWGREPAPTPSVFDLPHDHESDQYAVLHHGGDGRETRLVCGGIRLADPASRHLIDALPPVIHTKAAASTRGDWMRATLDLLSEETRQARPGGEAVVSRLCDIIVIQAIRNWIERDPAAERGWLGAVGDPQIGPVVAAVHAAPDHPWSVEALADLAAMSRSGFAARFTDLVGESAMSYVTRWRMHVATDLLRAGETIATTAGRVGYDSEAAFSRAFKRVVGVTPRDARRLT